jgi:heme oxygenase (biliverdin-IX-beta and delta-forming)
VSLLTSLRAGTRDAHASVEATVDVLRAGRTPAGYAGVLQAFRSVYAPLERALEVSPLATAVVPDIAERRKTAWLDADLAALRAPALADLDVPELSTVEHVAGACYVLEGATLGGAVVARELPQVPHRFFTSYGSRRGAMWAGFRAHLRALDERGVDREQAVASAQRTFALFERACA